LIIHTGTATADANGKLALQALGVVDHTTNLTLGRTLAGADGGDRLRLYEGSGAYFRLINDLAAGTLDGVLMDRPYALKQLAEFKRRQPSNDLTTEDVTERLAPDYPTERIGFALRRVDSALRGAMNQQLDALGPLKAKLIQQYVARPLPAPSPPGS
jgi:ABC-type amino acid transport substrate-binding protein